MSDEQKIQDAIQHVRRGPLNPYHVRAYLIEQWGMADAPSLDDVVAYCKERSIDYVKTKRVVEM